MEASELADVDPEELNEGDVVRVAGRVAEIKSIRVPGLTGDTGDDDDRTVMTDGGRTRQQPVPTQAVANSVDDCGLFEERHSVTAKIADVLRELRTTGGVDVRVGGCRSCIAAAESDAEATVSVVAQRPTTESEIHVGFGAASDSALDDSAVADIILGAAARHGVGADWTGDTSDCVCLGDADAFSGDGDTDDGEDHAEAGDDDAGDGDDDRTVVTDGGREQPAGADAAVLSAIAARARRIDSERSLPAAVDQIALATLGCSQSEWAERTGRSPSAVSRSMSRPAGSIRHADGIAADGIAVGDRIARQLVVGPGEAVGEPAAPGQPPTALRRLTDCDRTGTVPHEAILSVPRGPLLRCSRRGADAAAAERDWVVRGIGSRIVVDEVAAPAAPDAADAARDAGRWLAATEVIAPPDRQ